MTTMQSDGSYVLPIVIEKEFTKSLYHTLPLCVLRTDPHSAEWLHENFVNIEMASPQYSECLLYINQLHGFLGYSYDIFQQETVYRGIKISSIEKLVEKKLIHSGLYAYVMLDESRLSCKPEIQSRHFHDSLIYGCDPEKREFLVVTQGSKSEELLKQVRYSYDEFAAAHYGMVDITPIESIVFFKINPDYDLPQFSLENYLNHLIHYVNGIRHMDRHLVLNPKTSDIPPYGINIYSVLDKRIRETSEFIFNHFKEFHFLWEHKAGLLKGFRFLIEQGYADETFLPYVHTYESIFKQADGLRMLALKILQTQNLALLQRLCDNLIRIGKQEKEILMDMTEHLKTSNQNLHNLPVMQFNYPCLERIINLADFALIEMKDMPLEDGYAYHAVYNLTWDEPLYIRLMQFTGIGKIIISIDSEIFAWSNILAEDDAQTRSILAERLCGRMTLNIYSNLPISYDRLKLQIYIGSLTYQKQVTASSQWSENPKSVAPEKAVDYSEQFWNAQPGFPHPEFLEVDLGETYKINRILLQERPAHRIRKYRIEAICGRNEIVLSLDFTEKLTDEPRIHVFEPVQANKLRVTILETETDAWGYSEPGIKRFEAYYFPKEQIKRKHGDIYAVTI